MRKRGLRFFTLCMALLLLGACGEAPATKSGIAAPAELLGNIHDAVYLREGLDAAFIDGSWIPLEGAAYMEGAALMVPGGPLAERRGFTIIQRGGQAFITAKPREGAGEAVTDGGPIYVSADALAQALGLNCVTLTDGDVRGCALVKGPVADMGGITGSDSGDPPPGEAPPANSTSMDGYLSGLRDHWALLLKRGIELDDEGRLLHSDAMAADMLALCDPALGRNPFALRCAGYFDIRLLTPAATLFDRDERAVPGETFQDATIGLMVLPLSEGRVRVCVSFYPGEPMAWFRDAEDSEILLGPGQRAAQALMNVMDTLEFPALSREWGRSISFKDILDETMRENSRADVAVTGFGSAAAAAQAFVYLAWRAAPSDALVGYTFGAPRAAFTRLDTQDAPLPIFHALKKDDVLANAGAWFRPGREGTYGAERLPELRTPLECLRAAQMLLGSDPDDAALSLAWGLCGGEAAPRAWSVEEREALTRWVTRVLPERLGVAAAATRDEALLQKLADPQTRAAILSAHTLDAYAACTQAAESGWIAQRDALRLSDAAAGPVRLLDEAEAVLGAIDAEESDREALTEALERHKRIETDGLVLGFEAIEAESDALRLTAVEITDRYVDGPRGLRVGASMADVLGAFPGGETRLRRSGQTVLYSDPAQTGALRPPYGRVEASGEAQVVEYALIVPGEGLGFEAAFEARTLRILFDVREGSVARIRMELR